MAGAKFSVKAGPGTDIWKKPPSHDVFSAPFHKLSSDALNKFTSATITFYTTYVQQYDQGGLLLTLTNPSTGARKWIKAGVECLDSSVRLSVVCCDTWADWSVSSPSGAEEIKNGTKTVTIQVETEEGELGRCLWVHYVDGETKIPLREICWVYGYDNGEGWELSVNAAAARPSQKTDGELEVHFQDFDVKWDN
ncbi:hypothetical protein BGZ63DRAFT_362277 [Mariannaea sp. PMI_226]|nr:hypothetical protein BGZ63DRAFT_362277 [Mariannaea sp. PMI_226]